MGMEVYHQPISDQVVPSLLEDFLLQRCDVPSTSSSTGEGQFITWADQQVASEQQKCFGPETDCSHVKRK